MSAATYVGVLVTPRNGEAEYRVKEILCADGGVQLVCTDCGQDLPVDTVIKRARRLYENAKLFTDHIEAKSYARGLAGANPIRWVHVITAF